MAARALRYKSPARKAPVRQPARRVNPRRRETSPQRPGKRMVPRRAASAPLRRHDMPRVTPYEPRLPVPATSAIAKIVFRSNPYVRAFSFAWDAYKWANEPQKFGRIEFNAGPGWTKYCNLTPYDTPYGVGWAAYNNHRNANCGLQGQVWQWADYPPTPAQLGARNAIYAGPMNVLRTRFQMRESWWRPSGAPYIPTMPRVQPLPLPARAPRVDPAFVPRPSAVPRPAPMPNVRPFSGFAIRPNATTALEYAVGPNGRPALSLKFHRNERPRGRERKRLILGHASALMGAPSEALDLLDVLYGALPSNRRRRGVNPYDKAKAVWRHLDEIDWADAAVQYALNQAQDYVIGKSNQLATKPVVDNPYWVRPYGPTAGSQRWSQPLPF